MSFITRVIPFEDAFFGTKLDIYGSDLDPSRLIIMGTDGIEIPSDFGPATSIYVRATKRASSTGFVNGEYWLSFKPYISSIFRAIIVSPLPNLSGLYVLNVNLADPSRHDSYLSLDKKIPDPTVHIALLGD